MFTVRWKERAVEQLTSLWTKADSQTRTAIRHASQEIDIQLASNPLGFGESRPRGRRIHFVDPLAFLYKVDTAKKIAFVLQIWKPR